MAQTLIVRSHQTPLDYPGVWQAMQLFTATRQPETPDELWFLEHTPVYTQGQAGKPEHVLHQDGTSVIQSDRGGQITWHGPGQLMIYTLLDTRRLHIGAKALVNTLERILINTLASLGIDTYARSDAPGIYIRHDNGEAKVAAIGLRVRQKGCYHGAALNLDCTLEPYRHINPCGHSQQRVTRLSDLLQTVPGRNTIETLVIQETMNAFGYAAYKQASCHGR